MAINRWQTGNHTQHQDQDQDQKQQDLDADLKIWSEDQDHDVTSLYFSYFTFIVLSHNQLHACTFDTCYIERPVNQSKFRTVTCADLQQCLQSMQLHHSGSHHLLWFFFCLHQLVP